MTRLTDDQRQQLADKLSETHDVWWWHQTEELAPMIEGWLEEAESNALATADIEALKDPQSVVLRAAQALGDWNGTNPERWLEHALALYRAGLLANPAEDA